QISSERMETILCDHKLVYDIVVMQKEQQVWCGVLLNDENKVPTTESLEKLLKNLLSIPKRDFGDNEESSPLHSAVKMGNTIMAKNFIDSKSIWIDEPDPKGQTALHLSITYGDTEMASMLLKGGANVDAFDNDGSSACHIACRDGMIDHFNLLVYYHVDICSVDRAGRTPFDLACEHGQEKMVKRLFNCGLKKQSFQSLDNVHTASALHLAAETGQVQIISLLLCNNWDVNFTTKCGSALHMAAGAGQIQVVRFLLRVSIETLDTSRKKDNYRL
ncbi:Protein CBG04144, partial [Caenorhabditis briggsae]